MPSPIMPSPTMSSPRPGPLPQAKPQVKAKSPKKQPAVRKRLSSTPMREKSLIALAAKVRQRKEPKPSTEIFVPQIDSAFLLPETCGDIVGVVKPMEVDVRPTDNILPRSGLPVIKGNKDNDGMLLTNGQPFWFTDMPPDETDDELVMNASVLIEVMENRRKLVPMPDIEIVLDPMEETTVLAARDKSCYTRDVLFGNTVRRPEEGSCSRGTRRVEIAGYGSANGLAFVLQENLRPILKDSVCTYTQEATTVGLLKLR
ncbi:unnamed protein product [Haemonchus placei]|uniref:Polyprotein n=1 Tax=Haemonchus placei TaxID=6290 RepID=A0A0N4W6P0_HAEPC|nr:unnamed protein product [Haemonchus placei]